MKKIPVLLLLFISSLGSACSSHTLTDSSSKNEFERPVSREQFPGPALEVLSEVLPEFSDYQYFEESDGLNVTYEAKLTVDGREISIEFDTLGSLQDVEVLTDFESIALPARNAISNQFETIYQSFRIIRVQYQFSSETLSGAEVIENALNSNTKEINLRIEIELEGKNRRRIGFFEYLFESDGTLVQSRRITKRSLDNIW